MLVRDHLVIGFCGYFWMSLGYLVIGFCGYSWMSLGYLVIGCCGYSRMPLGCVSWVGGLDVGCEFIL
jgi:hypothetical protein